MPVLNEKMLIREVIEKYPQTREIFRRNGLMECGGPKGPKEPIVFFARVHNVDLEQLLAELDAAIDAAMADPAKDAAVVAPAKREG